MKKLIKVVLYIFISTLSITGCQSSTSDETIATNIQADDSGAFQELYEKSTTAKEFAESKFSDYMNSNGINDYTIDETSYGFITSESPTFIVGFQYSTSDSTDYYGYKLSVDNYNKCSVIEEGKATVDLIFK